MTTVFLHEPGNGRIYDEDGNEAMDIVDEEEVRINIKQLVNFGSYKEKHNNHVTPTELDPVDADMEGSKKTKPKTTKEYITYSDRNREKFFEYKLQHLLSVRAAAIKADVKPSTAKNWWNAYRKDPDNYVLGKATTRNSKNDKCDQLTEEHKQHLINYFDENPQGYIVEAVESLTKEFENLEIKKTRVNEFMKNECNLSFKKATFWPEARQSTAKISARLEWAKKWSQADLEFTKNCVFIDESGFNINMRASRAWGPKGKQAKVVTPTTKGISHSILGCISARGVINVSVRLPKAPAKIRKIQGGRKRKATPIDNSKDDPKGTTAEHYLKFIKDTLDIIDRQKDMIGSYLIMDNASIHTGGDIEKEIKRRNRGYKCVYLPPYSPELNPIEQFWAIVKKTMKRHKLQDYEMLEDRIKHACLEVPPNQLHNICQHSKKRLVNCLNSVSI
jgi:transposase